ncbi:endo-1,3(4)-beta-glucanase protein [Dioscorea alata]|uniref:Endo-1,3(4)-beta-glucanase protein n=1 Tax=Dioscorea alata TaxID=55571 RepID=A0ACB7VU00_DIOAL|nr:endo-1,3(4)-beta-glucanase protein [Dioscorea alata]
MLKKVTRRLSRITSHIITKTINKKRKKQHPIIPILIPAPSSIPSPPKMTPPPPQHQHQPFLFPNTQSSVLPDPSTFFSPSLSSPLPTNSFFQNFVLKNGDQPEYIHPYLIKSSSSSLSLSYPSRFSTPNFIYQTFTQDLTISSSSPSQSQSKHHTISSFNDLSLTLDIQPSLRFFLVRGSPFITLSTLASTLLSISTIHAILSFSSNPSLTKHRISLNNSQTFLLYSSSPLSLSLSSLSLLSSSSPFSGVLRAAILLDPSHEPLLDRFSSCYPISGHADLSKPFTLDYKWETKGHGDLLLLAHPLHLRLLDDSCSAAVLPDLNYTSIDGPLVGVVGDSWTLKPDPISLTWHSMRGVDEAGLPEIISALAKDVADLNSTPITTTSSYFYGKAIARAARLALIAEEVCFPDVIPAVRSFLKDSITPWLDGSFNGNGFLYDPKWGGIVTKQGSVDSGADFGFGIYNDHHYHLGYFLYAIAVLSRLDPAWGRTYRPQAYSMMADFMTLSRNSPRASYTRLRCFDLWTLHSWAGGLTEFGDGRNQESTSEAVNAYYSAALMGLSYGDTHLVALGTTLAALEMHAAATWWHVREGEGMYEEQFSKQNKLVGVLWANKRDSGLWFAPAEWKECRFGIQVLPLLPVTELLFRDVGFLRDAVKWAEPALRREGVGEGWKGFVYAMEGVYDKEMALVKTRALNGFDDGNSLSNSLWWIYSRPDEDEGMAAGYGWRHCWFGHYCH